MQTAAIRFVSLALLLLVWASPQASEERPVSFASDVRSILEKRCQPCHFEGGKMHEELPFVKAATIHKLGTKLFSRIRDEREREIIRAFLRSRPV